MSPTVGIVITCMNQVAYTTAAVNSIRTKFPFVLVVVDDFSSDGTKQWLGQLGAAHKNNWVAGVNDGWKELVTIIDEPTDSLGEKWNLGVQACKDHGCDFALVCNNDILFHPQTIDNVVTRLAQAKLDNENIGIVSAHNRRGSIKPEDIFTLALPEPPSEAESPDFSCFLIDIAVWEKIGKFPTIYEPCFFEDNHTHCELAKNGYRAITTTAAPYYHFGSVTQNSIPGGLCSSPRFETNRGIFKRLWGFIPGDPEYDTYVHSVPVHKLLPVST